MTARTAREGLASGLALLQEPSVPPELITAAEPVARAMGALMQAEHSDGRARSVRPHAEAALASIREGLAKLQSVSLAHPVVERAMEAVAGALATVLGLTRLESTPPPALQPGQAPPSPGFAQPPPYAAAPQQPAPAAYAQTQAYAPQQPAPQSYAQPQAPVPHHQAPPPAQGYGQRPPQATHQAQQPPPARAHAQPQSAQRPPQPAYQPAIQPNQPNVAPAFRHGGHAPPAAAPGGSTSAESVAPPAGTVEAELGAHSSSNFYKTLSGNDIVEHGGIFVSTYNIPGIGARITLRVHLPGGYHFDCAGLVKWTREARDNPDSPPGFGAQLIGITPDQRQLVQRYVRNREPLFYDDF